MKKVIMIITVLGLIAVFSSNAIAWDQFYHVKQAPNGKGDYLIFPQFFTAPGGWETKLTVTNTDPTRSVIAKVIVRSHYYSEEILDFMLYLSPDDVWVGYLRNAGTNTVLYSEDDSILVTSTTFASPSNPVNQLLFPVDCFFDDSNDRGYIEVIETWYGDTRLYPDPDPNRTPRFDATPPRVDKELLRALYPPDAQPSAVNVAGRTSINANTPTADGIDHTINVLTGFMELQNPLIPGMTTAMRAKVFADLDVTEYLNVKSASGINNITARNTIGEVEAAMSKRNIAMPYVNSPDTGAITAHLFTFPTKIARQNMNVIGIPLVDEIDKTTGICRCEGESWGTGGQGAGVGPYWFVSDLDCAQEYALTAYDLEERTNANNDLYSGGDPNNKLFKEEFNIVPVSEISGIFAEGWLLYDLRTANDPRPFFTGFSVARNITGTDLMYSGAPVIPTALFIKNGSLSFVEPAYDDGQVFTTLAGSWLPEYQYFNFMVTDGDNRQPNPYPMSTTFPPPAATSVWDAPFTP